MCLFTYWRSVVRVSFYTFNFSPLSFKRRTNSNSQSAFSKKQKNMLIGDLGMSVGVGVAMGSMAAGILKYKRIPSVFANSLEIGSIFSYLTYMGTLIATPFRVK